MAEFEKYQGFEWKGEKWEMGSKTGRYRKARKITAQEEALINALISCSLETGTVLQVFNKILEKYKGTKFALQVHQNGLIDLCREIERLSLEGILLLGVGDQTLHPKDRRPLNIGPNTQLTMYF